MYITRHQTLSMAALHWVGRVNKRPYTWLKNTHFSVVQVALLVPRLCEFLPSSAGRQNCITPTLPVTLSLRECIWWWPDQSLICPELRCVGGPKDAGASSVAKQKVSFNKKANVLTKINSKISQTRKDCQKRTRGQDLQERQDWQRNSQAKDVRPMMTTNWQRQRETQRLIYTGEAEMIEHSWNTWGTGAGDHKGGKQDKGRK